MPIPGWTGEAKYSGTVVAVDRAAGTILVEGMGPWRVKDGVTQLERRTIMVAPSTELMRLKRAPGEAPSGWSGDFVESALPTAIRIDVADPGEL